MSESAKDQGVHNFPPPVPTPGGPSVKRYVHGYQAVPGRLIRHYEPGVSLKAVSLFLRRRGYAIAEGRPVRQRPLFCCGIGMGWFLFVIGFFLAAIPWYVGAFFLICTRYDHREKPGYMACLISAILGTIVVIFGVTSDDWDWD